MSLRNPAPGTVSLSVLIIKSPFRITVKYSPVNNAIKLLFILKFSKQELHTSICLICLHIPALLPSLSPKTPLKTVSPLGEMTTRYETWKSIKKRCIFESLAHQKPGWQDVKYIVKFSPRCRCSNHLRSSPHIRTHPQT